MAKAIALTPDALRVAQHTPQAATPARAHIVKTDPAREAKADQVPLQVRLPRDEVRAIKVAAAERDQTISQFMLTCVHAYMKS
jgi:methionine-rich copper-binding protein CopC